MQGVPGSARGYPGRKMRRTLFERIWNVFADPDKVFATPFGRGVLGEDLAGVLAQERAHVTRVPQLAGDPQIFAAAHQRVGLAALGRRRNAVGVKVGLFTAGDGDEASTVSGVKRGRKAKQ